MALDSIVDSIPVPLAVAASLVVEGEHTARDLSYGLAAAYLAGDRSPDHDGQPVVVGDNALRFALGRSRRSRAEVEDARVYRMQGASLAGKALGGAVGMPALPVKVWGSGAVLVLRSGLHVDGDAQQSWGVDPRLAAAMRVTDDQIVELPWTLVQGAKHKASVIVMLRLLAWLQAVDPSWVKARSNRWDGDLYAGEHLALEIPPAALLSSLGLDAKAKPAVVMARMLEPAAREITALTGYRVAVSMIRTQYRADASGSRREGRVRAFAFSIDIPTTITAPARPVARIPGKPWRPAPRYHQLGKQPEAPPAEIGNVVSIGRTIAPGQRELDMQVFPNGMTSVQGRKSRFRGDST